jgi:hypothetical protein
LRAKNTFSKKSLDDKQSWSASLTAVKIGCQLQVQFRDSLCERYYKIIKSLSLFVPIKENNKRHFFVCLWVFQKLLQVNFSGSKKKKISRV